MGGSRIVRPDLRAPPLVFASPLLLSLLLAFLAVVTLAHCPVLISIPRRLEVSLYLLQLLGILSRSTNQDVHHFAWLRSSLDTMCVNETEFSMNAKWAAANKSLLRIGIGM